MVKTMGTKCFEQRLFRFFVKLGVSASFVLLSGCANTSDPRAIAEATKVSYDPYTKSTSVFGDMVQETDFPNILSYRLRAGIQKDAQSFVQLYVTYWSQSGWYFLSSANDIDGIALPVIQIDREVQTNATVEETVAVSLSRSHLDSHKSSGLNIRLTGQRGSVIVKVPPAYIVGFLAKFDTVLPQTGNSANLESASKTTSTRTLGVNMVPVPPQLAGLTGIPSGKGLLVVNVFPNSEALRADFRAGDIILEFDGREMSIPTDLQAAVKTASDVAKAEVVRGRDTISLTVDFTGK
jgi:membrane-associated protease RseP (regulator of RpoE activity)